MILLGYTGGKKKTESTGIANRSSILKMLEGARLISAINWASPLSPRSMTSSVSGASVSQSGVCSPEWLEAKASAETATTRSSIRTPRLCSSEPNGVNCVSFIVKSPQLYGLFSRDPVDRISTSASERRELQVRKGGLPPLFLLKASPSRSGGGKPPFLTGY